MIKILNLYAGLGGNRALWSGDIQVTAIENNREVAQIYKSLYPKDRVLVMDAHQFLLDHYQEFNFIWASPPCQTHSSFRKNICVRYRGTKPVYPDVTLYQEILFLKHHFVGKWVVENVKPYYEPLIKPTIQLQRHLFWSNFKIEDRLFPKENIRRAQIKDLQLLHSVDLSQFKIKNKRQVLRNCVHRKIGKHILECARNE